MGERIFFFPHLQKEEGGKGRENGEEGREAK